MNIFTLVLFNLLCCGDWWGINWNWFIFIMPKSKNTKHKQSSGPYQVNKKGSGAEDKGVKESQQDNNELQCDVCSDTAERLIQ